MEKRESQCNLLGRNELDHYLDPLVDFYLLSLARNRDQVARAAQIKEELTLRLNSQFFHYCKLHFDE